MRHASPLPVLAARPARPADAGEVLALLRSDKHLEASFHPAETVVVEAGGRVVACARLKPLGPDEAELASVVVEPSLRGRGVGAQVVAAALAGAPGRVYALALAPAFFAAQGFRALAEVPAPLVEKATSVCASAGFVPMVRERA